MKPRNLLLPLLFAVLLLSVSCGKTEKSNTAENSQTTAETATESTTAPDPEPDLPQRDYNGASFTFFSNARNSTYYAEKCIDTDALNGEPVNDAVYNRNLAIEQKFNVKIEMIDNDDYRTTSQNVVTLIAAGDDSVDVVNACGCMLAGYTVSGYYVNLYNLPYADLKAEYWCPGAEAGLSVKDSIYMMPCEISMSGISNGMFIYFNKKLISDYNLELPYTLVEKNKWTLDKFLEMTSSVSKDVNGDGVMDEKDIFGILSQDDGSNNNFTHFLVACGEVYTKTDKDGSRYYSVSADKAQTILEKLAAVFDQKQLARGYTVIGENTGKIADNSYFMYARQLFAEGHFLFTQTSLPALDEFREMEDDFGIVPNPKFDENQEQYYHRPDRYGTLFAVPVSAPDLERVGVIMEYSSWLSHRTVLPAYYEVTVKQKRTRDERDVAMLDLIRQTVYYDFGDLYDTGIPFALAEAYGSKRFASTLASKEGSINAAIGNILENFDSLKQGK